MVPAVLGIAELLLGFWAAGYFGRSALLLVVWVGATALTRGISDIFDRVRSSLPRLRVPQTRHFWLMTGRLTWLGHSTVLVELDGARVVTDPVLRRRVMHLRRERRGHLAENLDAVFISHLHYDHLDLPSLTADRRGHAGRRAARRRAGRCAASRTCARSSRASASRWPGSRFAWSRRVHDGRRRQHGRRDRGGRLRLRGLDSPSTSPATPASSTAWATLGAGRRRAASRSGAGARRSTTSTSTPSGRPTALALLQPRIAVPIHWGTYRVRRRAGSRRAPADAFAVAGARGRARRRGAHRPVGGELEL